MLRIKTVNWTSIFMMAVLVVSGAAASESWQVVEQPDLKAALEKAPLLRTESLGEPARGVNTWEHWAVPNPDGKTWDELQIYFKEYYGPTWLYAIDLGTGEVNKLRLPDHRQFYLSGRALGLDGKYYIATPDRSRDWDMYLHVYDPAQNTFQELCAIHGIGGETRPLATGPNGLIYGTGSAGKGQVGLYVFDPKSGQVVRNYGGLGPQHPNGAWSAYEMGVDDTHAYIVSGMLPAWYVVSVNLQTGEDKVLMEAPTDRRISVVNTFPGAWIIVPQAGGAPRKEYWLYHGQALPKVNDQPPWPKMISSWDKAGPKSELYRDQIDPDEEGHAALWYRSPDDAVQAAKVAARNAKPEELGWRKIPFTVEMYPHRISELALLPDGRLFSAGEDYVGSFLFDPKTDRATLLGRNQGIAPYTHIVSGDNLFSSGYPGGPLYVYDPQLPWTVYKGGPPGHPAPSRTSARSNPREMGSFERLTRVAIAHSSAPGADGKLYFGGFGERSYTGGGFGWYDPKANTFGGIWKPLSGYAVFELATANHANLIVISTRPAPDELNGHQVPADAKLFFYDVNQQEIVREIVPVPGARTTGLIAEIAPGRLLGLTVDGVESGRPGYGILYGLDVASGEVLFRKTLPWPVGTDPYWPHWVDPSYEHLALVHGPDGCLWTFLKDVLVRIDPKDASVHVVGRLNPIGRPTFVGNDLYFSGPEQLRRIRNIASRHSTVRVAGIVLKWLRADKEANYRRIVPLIREAAAHGAQIVCTTECFLDGYAIDDKSIPLDQYRALGEPIPQGPYFHRLGALARELKIYFVAGMLEADGDIRYNTAVIISPDGELVGKYHKQILEHESVRNTAGRESPVFDTRFGKIGLIICADRRFPEVVKPICERGPQFLLCLSGGMSGPKNNDPILQARSQETRKHIVFVHPLEFLVTGPDGTILRQAMLGNKLAISPTETGKEADSNRVFYFDLPLGSSRPKLAEEGQDDGFVPMFDGKTLNGWQVRDGNGTFTVENGMIVGTALENTTSTFLCTEKRFNDFVLELEFNVDEELNSGVQIRSNSSPSYQHGQVYGYQVEIDPSLRAWSGGIYDQDRRGWLFNLTKNEPARKAFRHNQWNQFHIECRGDSIRTWINGVAAADLHDSVTAEGFIGLQIHGMQGAKLTKPLHVRFRHIRLKNLSPKG